MYERKVIEKMLKNDFKIVSRNRLRTYSCMSPHQYNPNISIDYGCSDDVVPWNIGIQMILEDLNDE